MSLLRQLIISAVVLVAAFAGFVFFVPGSSAMLAKLGINLPAAEAATPGGAGPGQGRGNGGTQVAQQGGGLGQAPGGNGQRPGANGGGAPGGGAAPGGGRGNFGNFNRTMVVVTSPVALTKINDQLQAIGEAAAANSVTVNSPASGTLLALNVKPGDHVDAGAVIGKLDSDAETLALQKANFALQDAETTLDRTNQLAKTKNATDVQVAAAQLDEQNAKVAQQQAQLALDDRTITTPIAGTVGLFQVTAGNSVTPQTVITTIEDTSHLIISYWVPERYATTVAVGMPVNAEAVALPGKTVAGTVTAVDNKIDPESRTLGVEAQIPNDDGTLKPGMSYSVSMSFPGEEFPSVDPLAIQWSSDGAYVWQYKDGKVDKVASEIVQRNDDGVLIKANLTNGDQVVTQGVQQLTAGATVRLLDDLTANAGGNANGGGPASGGSNAGGQPAAGSTGGQVQPAATNTDGQPPAAGGTNGQRPNGGNGKRRNGQQPGADGQQAGGQQTNTQG